MIFRRLPTTIVGIYEALRTAFNQNANAGVNTILTNATVTRLNTIFPLFQTGKQLIDQKQADSSAAVAAKDAAREQLAMWVSHFLQTIIMAVERGVIPRAALSFYHVETAHPSLPRLDSEQDVVTAAENAISGEAARIAAGGTAIPFPLIADVTSRRTTFNNALNDRNTAKTVLDGAQGSLHSLMTEANGVIKKVWDEAETFYNEEDDAGRRNACRTWGVVYVSDTRIAVTAQALAVISGTATPLPDAVLTLLQTGESDDANEDGFVNLKTGFTGAGVLQLECPGYTSQQFNKNFTNTEDIDLGEVTMVAV